MFRKLLLTIGLVLGLLLAPSVAKAQSQTVISADSTHLYVNGENGVMAIPIGIGPQNINQYATSTPISSWPLAVDSGNANAYVATVTFPSGCSATTQGCGFIMVVNNSDSGASTISVDGGGVVTLRAGNGAAFTGSELTAGNQYLFLYDGHQWVVNDSVPGQPAITGAYMTLFGQNLGVIAVPQASATVPSPGAIIVHSGYMTTPQFNRRMICAEASGQTAAGDLCMGWDGDGVSILYSTSSLCLCVGTQTETFSPVSIQSQSAVLPGLSLDAGITQSTGVNAIQIQNSAAPILFNIDWATGRPGASGANCQSGASPAACGASWVGEVALPAGGTTLTVDTTAVTANSEIFVAADDTLGSDLSVTCNTTTATLVAGFAITARTAGTSFQITWGATPSSNPLCLSFHILN